VTISLIAYRREDFKMIEDRVTADRVYWLRDWFSATACPNWPPLILSCTGRNLAASPGLLP